MAHLAILSAFLDVDHPADRLGDVTTSVAGAALRLLEDSCCEKQAAINLVHVNPPWLGESLSRITLTHSENAMRLL